ncbi:hypothetical protein [Prescottella equi]|uniref:Uncharacterized protein n=1 Tax=Rhodococcus hoagii TaxID=43767 RepID=A0A9Q5WQV7_RHOHA|nr:hypothetical protein [Prescottella equi]MBM4491533.1 hypothetical protein [Prescottella equi]MBM4497053.1 hypothetical protein [Prescottella equi]MBM4497235.1 hypothetical protein [Prescottella equi]MBM4506325.1 hypothetical protein [Prescottella equi]MBM4509097.1 hypothetical protein [Prescottella equi]
MNTGSLVDLLTSVDLTPLWLFSTGPTFEGPVQTLVDSLFDVIGNVIALWPAGSAVVDGSLQDAIGSVSGA